jgi:hypothetical protein
MNNTLFGLNNNYNNSLFTNTPNALDASLAESYAKLEALKRQQQSTQIVQSTVFTDIDTEMKNLSEDEVNFITASKEYQAIANKYQTEFSFFNK